MSNWFVYDWELDGTPAQIHTDLSYLEEFDHLGDFTTLLTVTWESLYPDAERFTGHELHGLEKVLSRCLSILDKKAAFVGYTDAGAYRKEYFYTGDARLLVPMMNYCADERRFRGGCVKSLEPERQTYYRMLVPNQAKRQSVENRRYICAMKDSGDDLSVPRRLSLLFSFPSGRSRSLFAQEILTAGFAVGADDYVPEKELPYTLILHVISPLESAAVTHLTTEAISVGEAFGGKMENLSAAFMRRRTDF
jgi:hypothetical protein